ncbi:hypothetical protein ACO1O0_003338 [Amphichorda felina]
MCEIRRRLCPYCQAKGETILILECKKYWIDYYKATKADAPEDEYPDPFDCPDTEGASRAFTLGACPRIRTGCPSHPLWEYFQTLREQRLRSEIETKRAAELADTMRKKNFAEQHFQKRPIPAKPEITASSFFEKMCQDAVDREAEKEGIQNLRRQGFQGLGDAPEANRPMRSCIRKGKKVRFVLPDGAPEEEVWFPNLSKLGQTIQTVQEENIGADHSKPMKEKKVRIALPGAPEGEICIPGQASFEEHSQTPPQENTTANHSEPKKAKRVRFVLPDAPDGQACISGKSSVQETSQIILDDDNCVPNAGSKKDMGDQEPVEPQKPLSDKAKTTQEHDTGNSRISKIAETTEASKNEPVPVGYPMERQKPRRRRRAIGTRPIPIERKAPMPNADDPNQSLTEEERRPLRENDFTLFSGAPALKFYVGPLWDPFRRQPRGALPLDISGILADFKNKKANKGARETDPSPEARGLSSLEDDEDGDDEDTPESTQPTSQGDHAAVTEDVTLIQNPTGIEHVGPRIVQDANPQNLSIIRSPLHPLNPESDNENENGNEDAQPEYTIHTPPLPDNDQVNNNKEASDSLEDENSAIAADKSSSPTDVPTPETRAPRTNRFLNEDLRALMEQAVNGDESSSAVQSISPTEFCMPPRAQPTPSENLRLLMQQAIHGEVSSSAAVESVSPSEFYIPPRARVAVP